MNFKAVKWSEIPVWLRVLWIGAFLNFAVFFVMTVRAGGDAWNGYQKDGKYFLASHGQHTEVSHEAWTFNYWQTVSVWITHGSALVGALVWLCQRQAAPG